MITAHCNRLRARVMKFGCIIKVIVLWSKKVMLMRHCKISETFESVPKERAVGPSSSHCSMNYLWRVEVCWRKALLGVYWKCSRAGRKTEMCGRKLPEAAGVWADWEGRAAGPVCCGQGRTCGWSDGWSPSEHSDYETHVLHCS